MILQFVFLLYLLVLGFSFLSLFRKEIGQPFILLLAFPSGLILWSLIILLFLILGIPPLQPIILGIDFLVLAAVLYVNIKKRNFSQWRISSIVIYLILFGIVSSVLLAFNISFLSNDSWLLIIGGKSLATTGHIHNTLLASKGILSYVILSCAPYFGFTYPYALFPLLMMNLIFVMFYGIYSSSGEKRIRLNQPFLFSSLTMLFVLSGFFIIFNMFYIICNVFAAAFSFFALYGIYMRLLTQIRFWSIFSGLMLIGFSLSRLESNLFFLIPIIIVLSLNDIPSKEKIIYVSTVVGISLLWLFRLSFLLSDFDFHEIRTGYSFPIIGIFISLYLGVLLYLLFSQKGVFASINAHLPLIVLLALAAGWAYLLFTRGLYVKGVGLMIFKRYGDLIINVLRDGRWGMLWVGLSVLFAVAFFLKKIKYESVFLIYIFSFFLLFNVLNLYRYGWRRGWGDSGNRMLLYVVFVVAFYVFSKFSAFFFQRKQLNDAQ